MLTIIGILLVGALICAIMSAVKPAPILWIAVVLLVLVEALHSYSGVIR